MLRDSKCDHTIDLQNRFRRKDLLININMTTVLNRCPIKKSNNVWDNFMMNVKYISAAHKCCVSYQRHIAACCAQFCYKWFQTTLLSSTVDREEPVMNGKSRKLRNSCRKRFWAEKEPYIKPGNSRDCQSYQKPLKDHLKMKHRKHNVNSCSPLNCVQKLILLHEKTNWWRWDDALCALGQRISQDSVRLKCAVIYVEADTVLYVKKERRLGKASLFM